MARCVSLDETQNSLQSEASASSLRYLDRVCRIGPRRRNKSGSFATHSKRKYFQVDLHTAEILSDWNANFETDQFLKHLGRKRGIETNTRQLDDLLSFLAQNNLLEADLDANWVQHSQGAQETRNEGFSGLLRKLFFLKVHLFNPDDYLKAFLPFVSPLFTRATLFVIALIGLWGGFAVSRQWDSFSSSTEALISFKGTIYLLMSLALVKILHELGHAFTAARHGCYVPSMGIVFFAMFPLLYTDVSDAWKLSSSRQRMQISSAGVIVELSVACLATALWIFIPEGDVRNAVLALAATSWLSSLLFNLNPLMKFDGYYLLCDFLKIENLQPRAMALGQWKLRQLLIAPGLEAPERLPENTKPLVYHLRLERVDLPRHIVFINCFRGLSVLLQASGHSDFLHRPLDLTATPDFRGVEGLARVAGRSHFSPTCIDILCGSYGLSSFLRRSLVDHRSCASSHESS